MRLREATAADLPVMALMTIEGFESYRGFAGPAYSPPTVAVEESRMRETFARPGVWALVATGDDGVVAGHVALRPDEEPGCAYLWQLFVRPAHHGTALAGALHDAFLAAGRERGWHRARLRTPAGQARARRFYEREGWVLDGPPVQEVGLGLDLVVYRRATL